MLNSCEICDSSEVPTYNIQHPVQIDTYIILVGKYLRETRKPKAGYRGICLVGVSVEILHVNNLTLNACIGLAKANIHLRITQYVKYRIFGPLVNS